jgi:hypothetical protein
MKTGKSLEELSAILEHQISNAKDYEASTSRIEPIVVENSLKLSLGEFGVFTPNQIAHDQIAGKTGIPSGYYHRMMATQPELLRENIKTWFDKEPEKRLVRTLGPDMRAFLSTGYRPLDNYYLATAALPTLIKGGVLIKSCEVTDRRMYIQAVTERISGEVVKGDVVQAGIVISNSDVGCGALRIESMIYRLACLNGAIVAKAMRKCHIGRTEKLLDDPELAPVFSSGTQKLIDEAFWAKMKETISFVMSEDNFAPVLKALKEKAGVNLLEKYDGYEEIVEATTKRGGFDEPERKGLLSLLIKEAQGADPTQWNLANAVTGLAHISKDYDRSVDLERFGGEIMLLDDIGNLS